ncbi:hypothetical protein [Bdellovibrio reynosensis]|uniref:Outer membrane protein beta-barrel domain-containing protein n=1 Tax=Bdellovibrio reynosensis TaxID=2835041 RepID=A0ABY4CBP5_9BACT|nr:hypothetical protein [Bdellovibrio reynosensis]UOF02367.1 hypothetical protein MNR06_05305 [Bdellovibrio reynosensis]
MKKYIYILAALSMAPNFALAQSIESDVDAELDQMYSNVQAQPVAQPQAQAAIASSAPVSGQPIYILNQATPTSTAQLQQSQIQKQPTTVIEASPLTESRAEQIRRARQDAEVATEQRIVEKLEHSRMEDEKKRASVLFGDKFNELNNQQVQQQPVQAMPVQQVQVQQVEEPKENTRDIVREEIAAAMKVEEETAILPIETKYVGGILGIGDYPDVINVKGNYALGVAFGNKYDNFVIEGSFLYSNYTLDNNGYYSNINNNNYYPNAYNGGYYIPNNIDVNQYTGSLAAKVQLFSGIVKPVIGGVVAYSYRTFAWANDNYSYANNSNTANSHAIDIGTIVGADLEFSPKYSLGLDFRYMFNLSSRVNASNNWMTGPQYGTPIEKLQYYVMSLVARANF